MPTQHRHRRISSKAPTAAAAPQDISAQLTSASGSDTCTSGSFTPTAGSVLLASISNRGAVDPTFGGTIAGTWTKAVATDDANTNRMSIWWCSDFLASGTLTVSAVGSAAMGFRVHEATGVNTVTPIAQFASVSENQASPGSVSVSLTNAPTKIVFAYCHQSSNVSGVGGTGFTTIDNASVGSAGRMSTAKANPGVQAIAFTVANFGNPRSVMGVELA